MKPDYRKLTEILANRVLLPDSLYATDHPAALATAALLLLEENKVLRELVGEMNYEGTEGWRPWSVDLRERIDAALR